MFGHKGAYLERKTLVGLLMSGMCELNHAKCA